MDSQLSYFIDIIKKLDIIEIDIDKNQWDKLPEKFSEIKEIKTKLDLENSKQKEESNQELIKNKEKILSKINQLEKKIIIWKENQKKKIEKIKNTENHLNGYKKQPNRPYYIDKSE